jgi:hypothetical protein
MEALGGRGGTASTYSWPRHWMGWVVSVTSWPRFRRRKRTPLSHWKGGWVGPRAGLGTESRGKILLPLPGIEPRSPGFDRWTYTIYRTAVTWIHHTVPSRNSLVSKPLNGNYMKLSLSSVVKWSVSSRGSSVSIVSDCRLDDRATEVRSPGQAKNFPFSLRVPTSPEAQPASCPMGTGDSFPGINADWAWRWPLTSIGEVKNE